MVRFIIFYDRAGEYRWRLVAGNNEPVATSEGYTTKQGAINSAHWIKQWAPTAPIVDQA